MITVSEQGLEEAIVDLYHKDQLKERGLNFKGDCYRQLCLGSFGRADLIFIDKKEQVLDIEIVELKKDKVSFSTLSQAFAYKLGLELLLEEKLKNFEDYTLNWNITLIGNDTEVEERLSSVCFIKSICDNISVYSYKICPYKGLSFHSENYVNYTKDLLDKISGIKFPNSNIFL